MSLIERFANVFTSVAGFIGIVALLWNFSGWYHDDQNWRIQFDQRLTKVELHNSLTDTQAEQRYREIVTGQAVIHEVQSSNTDIVHGIQTDVAKIHTDIQELLSRSALGNRNR